MKSSRNNNIAKTLVLFFVLPLFLYSGVSLGASVDVANGNLHHSQTLFELPGSTMQNGFTLSYNSLDSNRLPLGVGWKGRRGHGVHIRHDESDSNSAINRKDRPVGKKDDV
ncbi:MAG: DUF6531 domain-containing protein [Nitrospiraceae bacterium]|nr:DUF6531 domain-containing protein [Nitrospiraceae bacterium]